MQNNEYHYIGVVFESFRDTNGRPMFDSKVYTYKTKKELKRGQLLEIEDFYGKKLIAVANDNIPANDINYPLDKIKEI